MKAIQIRKFIAPLLIGGALFATALPSMAGDHRDRHYGPSHGQAKHYRHKVKQKHHYHRGHSKHRKYKEKRVIHHHYVSHGPRHAPPRVRHSYSYSYDPAIVVSLPSFVIPLR